MAARQQATDDNENRMEMKKHQKMDAPGESELPNAPGSRRRIRPKGKIEWTFIPWIHVKPGTDIQDLLSRACEDQFDTK